MTDYFEIKSIGALFYYCKIAIIIANMFLNWRTIVMKGKKIIICLLVICIIFIISLFLLRIMKLLIQRKNLILNMKLYSMLNKNHLISLILYMKQRKLTMKSCDIQI